MIFLYPLFSDWPRSFAEILFIFGLYCLTRPVSAPYFLGWFNNLIIHKKKKKRRDKKKQMSQKQLAQSNEIILSHPPRSLFQQDADHLPFDDLKLLEGVDPKIEKLLNESGIFSFKILANTSDGYIRDIFENAQLNYESYNSSNWPIQAYLANENRWDDLEVLKKRLIADRTQNKSLDNE